MRALLEAHWDGARGFCVPNPATYPHLWLWDSCFHAVIWAHLGDERATVELEAVLAGQLTGGLVPHMRYGAGAPGTWLGPLPHTSSLAQPPMFGHAVRVLSERGMRPDDEMLERARRGLDWLWENRRSPEGLLHVVHPWEAGNDHSPRWDDWGAPGRTPADYDRAARSAWNAARVHDLSFDRDGAATWSSTFVVQPAAFNAYVAFNYAELAHVLDDDGMADRARRLAAAGDAHLWDAEEQLWVDRPIVGGGPSARIPLSDGVMGALVTDDPARAHAALDQVGALDRFGSPAGPANVARTHPAYGPGAYWRGAAWPHLAYLLHLAQLRWGRHDDAALLASRTRETAVATGWAEYWDAETGQALGAVPQSWTGLVLAMSEQ
ncbi:MGH1-like glycoside hydrolase domain-containing protein [Pseudonocardia nigra]|uniref:MGH1-like glycoside hydrolase domain-containing protein n=1 Tax=Pseudonocardia nigra TaxID=1921578 RepID=UPI001C5F86FD|nr:hypothetical protein [Pseudonocardia nigra]